MAITPNSNIRLLKVPFTLDNKNQLTFENKEEQFEFFNSLEYIEIEKCSYQRKDNIIRYPAHIDSIIEYNYCMYQNENYSDKWFYAFIVNMQYDNNALTNVQIITDVWQTWQFDISFNASFIEREMLSVEEDIAGANLLPESLEIGEITNKTSINVKGLKPTYIVAFIGDNFNGETLSQEGFEYNGIYSSITFIATTYLKPVLNAINNDGNGDKIFTVFTIPEFAISDMIEEGVTGYVYPIDSNFKQSETELQFLKTPENLDGYTPRNQKLRTYPYCYLGFTAQNGTPKIYRYENFEEGLPRFNMISEINPNPTVQFIPLNYKNIEENISESSQLQGYPNISYKNDYFNTWLAQNGNIVNLQMQQEKFNYEIGQVQGAINVGANFGNVIGGAVTEGTINSNALISGVQGSIDLYKNSVNYDYYIKNQMAQIEKQKLLPDNATMSNSNATLLGYNKMQNNIFSICTIKKEFAERIDKYFDMFGYLTNTVKIPNLNNRKNWNYVKTIGANIVGNIPQIDLQSLKNIFDNGVTLWHNYETFLDYSQNNR